MSQLSVRAIFLEDGAFSFTSDFPEDQQPDQSYDREPLELSLVRALYAWAGTPPDDVEALRSALSHAADYVEYYIQSSFRFSRVPGVDGFWTDGVLNMVLTQPSPTSFKAVGAVIWVGKSPGFCLAPFECDFHLATPTDSGCQCIIVRFGKLDRNDRIKRIPYDSSAEMVMFERPTGDSD